MQQLQLLEIPPAKTAGINYSREPMPYDHKIPWGYYDTVFEPCGFPRRVAVVSLEDPNFKLVPVCPWADTDHSHDGKEWHLA